MPDSIRHLSSSRSAGTHPAGARQANYPDNSHPSIGINAKQDAFAPMFLLKKILAALILPPTGPLLMATAGLWLSRHRPRLGQFLIALGLGTLLLLSTPWIANELQRSLQDALPATLEDLSSADAIVILGGGNYHAAPEYGADTVGAVSLERLRYGARLAHQTGLPVAVTGGSPGGGIPEAEAMREVLATDFRIASRWVETSSRDTAENAARLAPILRQAGVSRIVLVTHAWHMRRARAEFEKQGMVVVPGPTRFATESPNAGYRWLPVASALHRSQIALHEWLGILAAKTADALAFQ
jgi:uncharacterized SAM-binding protein YcdF (DUF218 family)